MIPISQITCPHCGSIFEIEEDYRGALVDCPECAAPFRIPETGALGVPVAAVPVAPNERAAALIEVTCCKCSTLFEVPGDYRGEEAECSECGAVFTIAEAGDNGAERAAAPALDPGFPDPARPPSPRPAAGPVPAATLTASGIQPAGSLGDIDKIRTVRLSRRAIIENTMKPEPKPAMGAPAAAKPAIRTAATRSAAARAADVEPPAAESGRRQASATAETELRYCAPTPPPSVPTTPPQEPLVSSAENGTPAALPKKTTPAAAVEIPDWTPDVELHPGEEVVGCEQGVRRGRGVHLILTLVPVLLIPAAVWVANANGPAVGAVLGTLVGVGVWGVFAARMRRRLRRKALVLTSKSVLMINNTEIVQVDLDQL